MDMKKIIISALLVLALVASLALAACGGEESTDTALEEIQTNDTEKIPSSENEVIDEGDPGGLGVVVDTEDVWGPIQTN